MIMNVVKGNNFGEEGIKILSESLKINTSLKEVYLSKKRKGEKKSALITNEIYRW